MFVIEFDAKLSCPNTFLHCYVISKNCICSFRVLVYLIQLCWTKGVNTWLDSITLNLAKTLSITPMKYKQRFLNCFLEFEKSIISLDVPISFISSNSLSSIFFSAFWISSLFLHATNIHTYLTCIYWSHALSWN